MTLAEDFILSDIYTLTPEDKIAIQKASSNPLQKEDWDKNCLKQFKKNIRKFLSPKQYSLCAYCRNEISEATTYFNIEHIVPKSSHIEWMFEPRNYCLSCVRCNSHKLQKETLTNVNCKKYPTTSQGFAIINPYYDKYSDHIEIIEDLFYKSKSPKGLRTIEVCNLSRYEIVLYRVKKLLVSGSYETYASILTKCAINHKIINHYDEFMEELKIFEQIHNDVTRYRINH